MTELTPIIDMAIPHRAYLTLEQMREQFHRTLKPLVSWVQEDREPTREELEKFKADNIFDFKVGLRLTIHRELHPAMLRSKTTGEVKEGKVECLMVGASVAAETPLYYLLGGNMFGFSVFLSQCHRAFKSISDWELDKDHPDDMIAGTPVWLIPVKDCGNETIPL